MERLPRQFAIAWVWRFRHLGVVNPHHRA